MPLIIPARILKETEIMGDKSPKSTQKNASQKQAKANSEQTKKKNAEDAKKAVKK